MSFTKRDLTGLKKKKFLGKHIICELKILRELHRLCDLSASLGWADGLSARGDQNCGQSHARGRDATPVRGRRAVPLHLSL